MKKILSTILALLILWGFSPYSPVVGQSIPALTQFVSTTTPTSAITQRTYGKAIKLTGLTTGLCLTLDANNLVTTTTCGSGGGTSSHWATSTAVSTSIHTAGALKVGIGTTSPSAALAVVGETLSSYFTATSTTATSSIAGRFRVGYGSEVPANGGGLTVLPDGGSGLVGIGNTNPQALLHLWNTFTIDHDTRFHINDGFEYSMKSSVGSLSDYVGFGVYYDLTSELWGLYAPSSNLKHYLGGNLGIGTSSPYAALSVVGQTVSGYFTATTSTASTFPYASTTAISATSVCIVGDPPCRTTWPTAGAGSDFESNLNQAAGGSDTVDLTDVPSKQAVEAALAEIRAALLTAGIIEP